MLDLVLIFALGFLAATVSGAAGFGGALILLPFLSELVGIKAAVPILTIGQIFGNASRVWLGRNELKWKPITFFLLTAVPFTLIGSYLFTDIDGEKIKVGIGIFLILLTAYRRMMRREIRFGESGMLVGGGLTGFLSGIAGSAGPLGATFFLGLNLTATAYVASEAVTALTMHLIKTAVYQRFSLIGSTELLLGIFIGIAMIGGSWTGKKIIERISKRTFIIVVEVLLILSGIQMIVSGLS